MAYCRIGEDSDVYLYEDCEGFISCCGCGLPAFPPIVKIYRRSEALAHLNLHVEAGEKVPERAFRLMREDLEKDGDLIEFSN